MLDDVVHRLQLPHQSSGMTHSHMHTLVQDTLVAQVHVLMLMGSELLLSSTVLYKHYKLVSELICSRLTPCSWRGREQLFNFKKLKVGSSKNVKFRS